MATRSVGLSPEQRLAIKRDLALHPAGLLADTLRGLLDASVWVEQEAQLDRLSDLRPVMSR